MFELNCIIVVVMMGSSLEKLIVCILLVFLIFMLIYFFVRDEWLMSIFRLDNSQFAILVPHNLNYITIIKPSHIKDQQIIEGS